MATQTNPATTGVLPRDAKEALELWDKGEPLAAFEVESEGTHQNEIYAVAFELIRGVGIWRHPGGTSIDLPFVRTSLSKRELDAARSIAHVALLKGWAAMVAQHLASGHIRAIIVAKKA